MPVGFGSPAMRTSFVGGSWERCQKTRQVCNIPPPYCSGVAAGWAFYDLASQAPAPKAIVFGRTNPVMVQGAVFAGVTITEGWSEDPAEIFRSGDTVRVDPRRKRIDLLGRAERGRVVH